MAIPQSLDYFAAIQNPHLCFLDQDLKQGRPLVNARGLPKACTGNFADVYKIEGSGSNAWAVKCFTREVRDLQQRYKAISAYLKQAKQQAALPFMVDFDFVDRGIRVNGQQWVSILKMSWIEGESLTGFIPKCVNKPQILTALAGLWLRLARDLKNSQMAHGDLQHGNVLLVPNAKGGVQLKLIDYDGMFVPTLADSIANELGHPNYQHPKRGDDPFHADIDRFSHLVIYTALRCLAVADPGLWSRYENDDNLLFKEQDFKEPGNSAVFKELWKLDDLDVHVLVGRLILAAQGPSRQAPLLDEIVKDDGLATLTRDQENRVAKMFLPVWKSHPKVAWSPAPADTAQSAAPAPWPTAMQSPATKVEPLPLRVVKGEVIIFDLGNGVRLEVIKISAKGKKFQMGSPKDEAGRMRYETKFEAEEQHEVSFIHDFYMGKYEVAQEQYHAVMGNNPSRSKGAKKPVENVSWNDAQVFIKKLNEMFKDNTVTFRLPSESEWEFACRAGTATAYYFGKVLTKGQANFNATSTKPVGSYEANTFGLYDMHGNVWEWCEDYYGPYNAAPNNGKAQRIKQLSDVRVLRGGGWLYDSMNCRSAGRSGSGTPDSRRLDIGFRVAVSRV